MVHIEKYAAVLFTADHLPDNSFHPVASHIEKCPVPSGHFLLY